MDRLRFENLGNSIIHSLSVGIIAFDSDMNIIEANSKASELINVGKRIDKSIASGTDIHLWNEWKQPLKAAVKQGKEGFFEAVSYTHKGTDKLLDIYCMPIHDQTDEATIGGVVIIEDVTDRIHIERQLADAEKFAAVGKVAGKVAHELNNPMDGILRYINLADRVIEQGMPEKANQYLQHCRTGLKRMTNVVSELLEFSRTSHSDFDYEPLTRTIEEALRSMEPYILSSKTEIVRQYKLDFDPLYPGNLFQVFCNIIKNAVDAMTTQGTLTVTAIENPSDITIRFQDTGPGIDPKTMESIFDPFFTTKNVGKGTGLGLSICKDIVAKYGGQITASNMETHGCVFSVILPKKHSDKIRFLKR